jgi:hypothetical protein
VPTIALRVAIATCSVRTDFPHLSFSMRMGKHGTTRSRDRMSGAKALPAFRRSEPMAELVN